MVKILKVCLLEKQDLYLFVNKESTLLFVINNYLSKALFSSPRIPKSFQDSPSHRILRHMYEALNIDEK